MAPAVAPYYIPGIAVKLNSTFFAEKRIAEPSSHILKLTQSKFKHGKNFKPRLEPLVKDPKIAAILREKVALAKKLNPDYKPANFDEWYEFIFEPTSSSAGTLQSTWMNADEQPPTRPEIAEFAEELSSSPEFLNAETLGPYSIPQTSTISPWDDPQHWAQSYLDNAPVGIGARNAWSRPGGTGAGLSVTDIEWGWALNHEDFIPVPGSGAISLVGGTNSALASDRRHGTSSLGVMIMKDNTKGGVGVAPQASAKVVGVVGAGGIWLSMPELLGLAMDSAQPGEVILIEMQVGYKCMEVETPAFEAIQLATSLGYHVVEPAGNGNHNLDDHMTDGKYVLRKGHPDFRESGAIIVGAGSSSYPHNKMSFSTYGSRVDVYAFGENVYSTDTDTTTGTSTNLYTFGFSGTSSASPIIAGAVMQIQGMYKAKNSGALISPSMMRDTYLKTGGTPSSNPTTDKIGVQPDIQAIITAYGF